MILSFLCSTVCSQPLLFENYSSEQGLSQNSCYSIAQDADGFMWFGTQDGLNRFDGKQFKVFLPQTVEGKILPSNHITSLYFDNHENLLWIGTPEGLCLYHPRKDSLVAIDEIFSFASVLKQIPIKKITSFKAGEYWIVTTSRGLLYLNTQKQILLSFFDGPSDKNQVSDIIFHEGKIIVSLYHRLYILHPQERTFGSERLLEGFSFPEIKELHSYRGSLWIGTLTGGCFYIEEPIMQLSNVKHFETGAGGIGCFVADSTGNLWIGTRGNGIVQYNPVTKAIITAVHNQYDDRSPGKNFVLSLFKDRQGIVWCGLSGAGIAKYDPLKYQFHSIRSEATQPGSLPDDMVFDIFKSRDGNYFAGTQNKGLLEWNGKANEFISYPATASFGASFNTIYDITEDEQNNLWIASWGGLIQLNRNSKEIIYHTGSGLPAFQKFYSITKLRNADSLFLTGENGSVFFSLKDYKWKSVSDNIFQHSLFIGRYVYEDESDILWIGTAGSGLIKYDYRHQHFEIIEQVKNISLYVRHLFSDELHYWLATDNGVVVYDPVNKRIVKHILPTVPGVSKVCYAIQKDNEGFFWVSTNTGLYKINPETYSVEKNYDLGNGLSFLEYNTACALRDEDDIMMFGGVGGITQFNPTLLKENTFSPAPLITGIYVNDVPVPLPSDTTFISLNHQQNFLTLYFAVTNFSNHANNQFAYRLKGLTENWTYRGNQNFSTYTSLPSGDYVFELRSANSDGKWSNAITMLAITIHPPWWQTWWFTIAVALILTGVIYYFIRRRINVIHQEADIKQQLAELEIKGLHAQMNPHFIFNCLNSIKEMILEDQKQYASRYLSKFAQLIRTNLEQSRQTFITVKQCIDHLQQYLEMEKIRFEDFSYSIHIDDDLDVDAVHMPPMLLQPLVENAIWHGLHNKDYEKKLDIRFVRKDGQLICEIEDNGIGYLLSLKNKSGLQPVHRSVGIANIYERLELMNEKYDVKCSLSIKDKLELPGRNGSGTIATLKFNLNKQPWYGQYLWTMNRED